MSLRIAFCVEQHFLLYLQHFFYFRLKDYDRNDNFGCGRRWARYQFPDGLAWWEAIPGPDQQHHHPWTADDCCRHLLGSHGCNVEWRTKSLWCYVSIIIMISSDESDDLVHYQSITLIKGLSIHVKNIGICFINNKHVEFHAFVVIILTLWDLKTQIHI